MLLKSLSCASILFVSGMAVALPDLPEPVSNNAVTSTTVRGKTYIISMMGTGPGGQPANLHNKVWMHTLGEFGWSTLAPVPSVNRVSGRFAASAVALNNNFFVLGGTTLNADGSKNTVIDSYRFNPVTQQYTRLNDIPVPVDDAVALPYLDRYIYVINGWSQDGNVNLVQLFDNYTQRWLQATPFPGKAVSGLAGGIQGNTILLCDGVSIHYHADKPREFLPEPACYLGTIGNNVQHIQWQPAPHPDGIARFRAGAIATQLDNEPVIVFLGGSTSVYHYPGVQLPDNKATISDQVWVFSINKKRWLKAETTTPVMDLRGLISINDEIWSIGGTTADNQPTNKLVKHSIKLLPNQ